MSATAAVVTLMSGQEVPASILTLVTCALETLIEGEPDVYRELMKLARNSSHELSEKAARVLREISFLGEDGCLANSVRTVVIGYLDHWI